MSAHRYDRELDYDPRRLFAGQHRGGRNGDSYNSDYRRSPSQDRYRRSPSPRGRYSSPPHDRYRDSHSGDDFEIKGASTRRERDTKERRPDSRNYNYNRRDRSPSARGRDARTYRDRDHENYRSPSYDSRDRDQSRSRSRKRDRSPYYGGPPSREVILEGLAPGMVEEDISKELKQYHGVDKLEDVRIIRDRQTKVSRGFGFLRFATLDESKAFVERNYPTIQLYGQKDLEVDHEVRIAYSREREDPRGEREDGKWTCKICTFVNFAGRKQCHRCQAPQVDMASFVPKPQYLNSGDSDVSPDGMPSQFLLLRGLEPTVTEDLLAKGVAKLYKPGRRSPPPASTTSKKNNAKVASTTGDANLGAKDGSLRRVLLVRDRRNNESWRYGFAEFATIDDAQAALIRYNSFEKFTISSKPVTADYIHAGVFVPVFFSTGLSYPFAFSPLGNPTAKLQYWDEEAWASELVLSTGSPKLGTAASEGQVRSAADQAATAAAGEGLVKPGKEAEARAKKRKAEANAAAKQKKTAPAHLQFWSNRHAELHGVKPNEATEHGDETTKPSATKRNAEDTATPMRSYANLSKKCCYLCTRQFKTEAEVNKHERMSDLHRENTKNEELVSKALTKMAKAGIAPITSVDDDSEYRDRAKERRAAFGGGKKLSLPLKKSVSQPEKEEAPQEAAPVPSKGASLLGKMGWSAGEGLGAQGTGMTAPISTDMYVQGVGLGAQGGKKGDAAAEADRNTKGSYGDFLQQTRDKAKERFESMG